MALKHLRDSDSEFSDDDDLIDPEEKMRLVAEAAEKEASQENKDNSADAGVEGPSSTFIA